MAKNVREGRDANRPAKRAERAQAAVIEAILEAAGIAFRYERGRHLCIVAAGQRLPIAGTPRNEGDAVNMARQSAQRLVRQIKNRST